MDSLLLIKATLRIYLTSVKNTYKQIIYCWKFLIFQLLIALACLLVSSFSKLIPGIAGGFILGMFLALAASCYLASISSTFSKERKSFQDLFYQGLAIFNPLIGVLFSFFIIHLVTTNAPQGLNLFIGLAITVIFNPAPEIVQLRPGAIMQMFADSLEFIRDNLFEWNLPFFILIGLVYLIEPNSARLLFYFFATTNPVDFIQYFLLNLSASAWILISPATIISLVLFYCIFVFRLNLFQALSTTTKRKRIYSER